MRSHSALTTGTAMVVVCPIVAAPSVREDAAVSPAPSAPPVVGMGFGHQGRVPSPQITLRCPHPRRPSVCCRGRVPLHQLGMSLDGVHSRLGRVGYLRAGRTRTQVREFIKCTIAKVAVVGLLEFPAKYRVKLERFNSLCDVPHPFFAWRSSRSSTVIGLCLGARGASRTLP
jgi:hypothetical protein